MAAKLDATQEDAMPTAIMPVLRPQPVRMPPRTARPRLRLVGPDDRGPEHWIDPKRWAETDEVVGPFEGDCGQTSVALRLTRRGRLFMTLMVTLTLAALAVVLATSVDAAALPMDAPQIRYSTTVSAGQTLSEVAATHLPSLPIHEGVARIQLANGLNTSQVHAGQSLLIPGLP